jgi:hypothetical protein
MSKVVIPGLTRNPVLSWIPASAGMTNLRYIIAGVIHRVGLSKIPSAYHYSRPRRRISRRYHGAAKVR